MNNTTTILLFISLIINTLFLVIAAIFIQKKAGLPYLLTKIFKTLNCDKFSSNNDYNPTYLHKTSQFEKLPKSEPGIILLGDSLTDEGEWALLENPNIKKRGISGDTTNRILHRLRQVSLLAVDRNSFATPINLQTLGSVCSVTQPKALSIW